MYLSAKFGDYRPYRKKVINSYVNYYMKTELTASIRHIAIFFKLGIPIYSSQVPDTDGRNTRRRRRAQAITKRCVFHANTKNIATR